LPNFAKLRWILRQFPKFSGIFRLGQAQKVTSLLQKGCWDFGVFVACQGVLTPMVRHTFASGAKVRHLDAVATVYCST
jgi:hypothetical protein